MTKRRNKMTFLTDSLPWGVARNALSDIDGSSRKSVFAMSLALLLVSGCSTPYKAMGWKGATTVFALPITPLK